MAQVDLMLRMGRDVSTACLVLVTGNPRVTRRRPVPVPTQNPYPGSRVWVLPTGYAGNMGYGYSVLGMSVMSYNHLYNTNSSLL
jgi:hypothetical protein